MGFDDEQLVGQKDNSQELFTNEEETPELGGDFSADAIRPRNTLVAVKRHKKKEKKYGNILVPNTHGSFEVADVVAVGPGNPSDRNEHSRCSDTSDLEPGMRVLIKTASKVQGPGGQSGQATRTLPFSVGGEDVDLIDQRDILCVLDQ